MRRAMGIAVLSGMIGVTALPLPHAPVFYVVRRMLTGNRGYLASDGAAYVTGIVIPVDGGFLASGARQGRLPTA